jgi:HK97 family phage prohead protease
MELKQTDKKFQRLYDEDHPDLILAECSTDFEFKEELSDFALENGAREGDIEAAGWFITQTLIEDRRLIVKADAFSGKDGTALFNGRLLAFHNRKEEPVGRVLDMKIVKGKGIKGRVLFYRENTERFKRALQDGTLNAFSIGFEATRIEYNEKTDTITVLEGSLKEVSVVNLGADKNATFRILEALKQDEVKLNIGTDITLVERGNTLSNKNVNIETMLEEHTSLKDQVTELRGLYDAIKTTQDDVANDRITKSELAEKLEKFSEGVEGIRTEVEALKAEKAGNTIKLAHTDYRSLITDFVWLTDDGGNRLPDIAQKAYCLFQAPVDYDKMEYGNELKNLRDLHDAVVLYDSMATWQKKGRHNIQHLAIFKQLVECTKKFDNDIALAMAGGNTGYGAEWIPSELSSEFNEYLRKQPTLSARFQTWQMPKGGSAKFPFQNGKAVVYKGGEATVDNPEEARKTSVATEVKLFTPDVFIGALVASEEITEDAVLDMVGFIRRELATALLEGLESAICNGDDSTTHFDNTVDTVYQTYNVETCFKGLRKLGDGNARDIETSSSTTGVNALELVNFTDAKQDLGVAGLNPADCLYVTGIKGRTQVQQALFKEDALGVLAFMISGTLPTIDGSEIYISGQWDEALSSAGIRDSGADTKHTSMACVHKPSFRVASRRGVTVEFNKNILTQQHQFVATARWDYGKISADAIEPVAGMENIQHTA